MSLCFDTTRSSVLGSESKLVRLAAFVLLLSAVCWRAGRDWFFFTEGPVCYRWWSSSCQRHLPENMEVIFCSRRRTCEARWWMILEGFPDRFRGYKNPAGHQKLWRKQVSLYLHSLHTHLLRRGNREESCACHWYMSPFAAWWQLPPPSP